MLTCAPAEGRRDRLSAHRRGRAPIARGGAFVLWGIHHSALAEGFTNAVRSSTRIRYDRPILTAGRRPERHHIATVEGTVSSILAAVSTRTATGCERAGFSGSAVT